MRSLAGVEGGPGGSAPSLAPTDQSSTPETAPDGTAERPWRTHPCGSGQWLENVETGEVQPARCKSNRCAYCLRLNALRRAAAIAYAQPERAVLLTLVGEDFPTIRRRMNRMREYLTRAGVDVGEWCWHVEPNPAGNGHHVHAWQHGPVKIPQALLSECAARAGMGGVVFINRVRSEMGSGQYGLKGVIAAGYGLKGVEDQASVYLSENGGRLSHATRGFFRDAEGAPIPVRVAERRAYGEGSGTWRLLAMWDREALGLT